MSERDDMVERVARIIRPGAWEPEAVRWCWELWVEKAQEEARSKARAILASLNTGKEE